MVINLTKRLYNYNSQNDIKLSIHRATVKISKILYTYIYKENFVLVRILTYICSQ